MLWLCLAVPKSRAQTTALHPQRPAINLNEALKDIFPIQPDGVDLQQVADNLAQLQQNPLNLNTASRDELVSLFLLSERQRESLLRYRETYGSLLSLYELQAIPEFDPPTIRRLLPFVLVADPLNKLPTPTDHYFLLRFEQVLEQQKGFSEAVPDKNGNLPNRYTGNAQQWFIRYRYSRPNAFSFGFTAEKDPGERISWIPARRQYGPDYVSFHVQIRNQGKLKNLIAGDYQLQLGQSLICSAGFVMGKNSETILTIRRPTLGARAYTSLTESGFFRGLATTYALTPVIDLTVFGARNRRSANLAASPAGESVITSFITSGLNRTESELADRYSVTEINLGAHILFQLSKHFQLGATGLKTIFDHPVQKRALTYNQFEFSGTQNLVLGCHGTYSRQNWNAFGEFARSSGSATYSGGIGLIGGVMASLSRKTDVGIVFRHYDRNFHSFYANGFSENSRTINETGVYLGAKYSLYRRLKIGGYLDFFRFPWWRYLVDGTSGGVDYLTQATYTPNRKTTFSVIVHREHKQKNLPGSKTTPRELVGTRTNQLVVQAEYTRNRFSFRSRVQGSRFRYVGLPPSQGISFAQDASWQHKRWQLSGRLALFNTDDYDSRLYTYEQDVLTAFSFPAYFYNGIRHYLLAQYTVNRHMDVWFRWARTGLTNQPTVGSDLDQIPHPHKTEIKVQMRWRF
ncbi:ComEA family DNA-binding protein [Arsenicibacter rosenii]|nr:helix-hairpin-helix domain-containing protein [Arsenicibacter rosenii]